MYLNMICAFSLFRRLYVSDRGKLDKIQMILLPKMLLIPYSFESTLVNVSGVKACNRHQQDEHEDKGRKEGKTYITTTLKMLAIRFDPVQPECMQERR